MNQRNTMWLAALAAAMLASGAVAGPPQELKKDPPANATRPGSMSQAAEIAGENDLICTYESTIGSHLKRRVCQTRGERERQAAADQESLRRAQGDGRGRGRASVDPATGL